MLQIECIESKQEEANVMFSRFSIGPLNKGQGITIGNALRRTLLSNLEGLAIVGVRIAQVNHEFSTIPDVKEDVIEILLNLKQIVFKGQITDPIVARLAYQGPGIVTAKDIELPDEIFLVEPRQYLASVTAAKNLAVMYRNGHGVTKNEEMCFSLNLKAAKSGDVDAQLQVMGSYVHGNGVAISKKDAAYWCNLAREKGSPAAEAYWESFELSKYE